MGDETAFRYLIINGFDRSGSSMVARVLAKHPQVETLFQPFSSTEVHRSQWEIWDGSHRAPVTEAYLNGLLGGVVNTSYHQSDWVDRFSSTLEPRPGALHVIKETKLHFKVEWLRTRFPGIPFMALYRDLREIVASLVRNGFHRSWYGGALEAVEHVVRADPELEREYGHFFGRRLSEPVAMGVVVAVRTDVMGRSLRRDDWLHYEKVTENVNGELGRILDRFQLASFDFEPHIGQDYSIVGSPYEGRVWGTVLAEGEAEQLGTMDARLRERCFEP
jgi:hypothetical protein